VIESWAFEEDEDPVVCLGDARGLLGQSGLRGRCALGLAG
jgi:hypothetical protein